MKQALGIIEVSGLAAAVKIADVLVKSASVKLLGVEPTKGSGWMTIKVVGNVGAVQAAVEAGTAQATFDGKLISAKVIPRPVDAIEEFFLKEKKVIVKHPDKVDKKIPAIKSVAVEVVKDQKDVIPVTEMKLPTEERPEMPKKITKKKMTKKEDRKD